MPATGANSSETQEIPVTAPTNPPATPNNMPGAPAAPSTPPPAPPAPTESAQPAPTKETSTPPVTTGGLTSEERAELDRYRAVHKDESKWENRSKANAKKLRDLAEAAGLDVSDLNLSEFDPKIEFTKLRDEVEQERTARARSEVARIEGVDIEDVHGTTEAEMRASAQRIKARIQAEVDKALAAVDKTPPAAAPANSVTSDGKITGPEQITSQDELKKLSPQEIVKARKEGRLDGLLGKSNT